MKILFKDKTIEEQATVLARLTVSGINIVIALLIGYFLTDIFC
jgi:hypothetical protein